MAARGLEEGRGRVSLMKTGFQFSRGESVCGDEVYCMHAQSLQVILNSL